MAEFINRTATFGEKIILLFSRLNPDFPLPDEVEILQPYAQPEVRKVIREYYTRYYNDTDPRIYLLGINPGRFGGGITGIPFTDPVRLKELEIQHSFSLKPELSSDFIYRMIRSYGGVEKFTADFFLTAISPIGYTRKGKNFNYYDDPQLESAARPWIIKTMNRQLEAGARRSVAICLGEGTNFRYLNRLNEENNWFGSIRSLPHPRWIMQYRRKNMEEFIQRYVDTFAAALK